MVRNTVTKDLDLSHARLNIEKTKYDEYIIWIRNKSIDEHTCVKLDRQQFDMLRCMILENF